MDGRAADEADGTHLTRGTPGAGAGRRTPGAGRRARGAGRGARRERVPPPGTEVAGFPGYAPEAECGERCSAVASEAAGAMTARVAGRSPVLRE